ncbi:MAG: DUF11 domain-containing protein [Chloroflexota bacterium]
MNKFTKYRRFIVNIAGILPLIISLLGSSQVVLAATATSDISITMVADRSRVQVGQNITYIATMTNHGSDDAIFVDVGFSLPDQLNLVSITCDKGISADTPFCEYSSLKAGETVVSTLVATPNPSARNRDRSVMTTASVSFEIDCNYDPNCTLDPIKSNNFDSVLAKIIGKLAHP